MPLVDFIYYKKIYDIIGTLKTFILTMILSLLYRFLLKIQILSQKIITMKNGCYRNKDFYTLDIFDVGFASIDLQILLQAFNYFTICIRYISFKKIAPNRF
jgi:hypothetical protein